LREDREPPENDPPAEESENQTSVEEQPIPDNSAQKYSSLQIIASSDSFAYSGAASSQSKTSSLFLNNFLLRSSLNIDPDIDIHAELGFGFGSTTKGDFSGFSLRAEPLYHLKSFDGSVPGIDKFLAGASVRYETLGVTKQTFGGWDLFTVSPSFHAQSAIYFREENQIVDLDFSLKFALLTSGNAGIRGKTRDFEGLSQTEWELLGTLRPNPQEIEWGGFLANRSGSGKVGSRTLNFERLSLGVSARLAL
jgi:hypothetical protein